MQQRSFRYPSNSVIRLISRAGPQNAHLLDVSKGGARLIGNFHLVSGEQIALRFRDFPIRAEVRWVASGRAGVAFLADLSPDLLDDIATFAVENQSHVERFNSAKLREMR